ncbi:hypothetical protein CI109_107404 [Kwoniella shandongensis]|uniref:Uncharacterized protein n=1 Tax=Kwoniella shandongensis TaxID=1734106 RepID=A0A5M6BYC3_9TREE|nr:uncharacterized protein CI109_004668 [Kwoniella shandongensis]KAA5526892.1 hypothetical protein CI109_004668 [Kwoniella shandongensis]
MPSSSSSSSDPARKKKEADAALAKKRKEYLKKADPSTVNELKNPDELEKEYFREGEWRPSWALVEFDSDACLKNVTEQKQDGFYVPAGTILPLGAQMPEMTVLKYGAYIPEGTSFPGGVLVPMHARMVNLLPQETKKAPPPPVMEGLCLVQ